MIPITRSAILSSHLRRTTHLLLAILAVLLMPRTLKADVLLADKGQAHCAIFVAPEVMADDKRYLGGDPFIAREAEDKRRKLRESVKDLAVYLQKITGADVPVVQREPAKTDKAVPLLIGAYAEKVFGGPAKHSTCKQGYRLVISSKALGFIGESDEATGYAIYTLLDRLGCRWYLPSEMGEEIPHIATLRLADSDVSDVPSTEYRGIWYAEEAYRRRNRMGGFQLQAGHALERYITEDQRKQHLEWRAIINDQPHPVRLRWSNPEVQNAVADAIIAKLDKDYVPSVSLSPEDGAEFDESDDKAWDAGDWDPIMNQVSITDRYVKFCNIVAERVCKKYPDVQFGFLAYVQYTRPPIREKALHPNLVPQIAPITYCRAHAMTDKEICPSRAQIQPIVEGWGKVAKRVSYYNYMYQLAEPSVPYPMIHQMSQELPIIYANNVAFWQPETMPNFESALPGTWLSIRMSWDKSLKPDTVLDEFFRRYYGAAEQPMRRYWKIMDDAWATVPEHAGCGFGYMRRFTPGVMKAARAEIDSALAAAKTPTELKRVQLQHLSLRQFERFMQLRWDLNEGRLANMDYRATEWLGSQMGLADEYAPQASFSKVPWSPHTMNGTYFKSFYEPAYKEGARIAREYALVGSPLRLWKYQVAGEQDGVAAGWSKPEFADTAWKTTDVGTDTWSDLDLQTYYGTVWYRQSVKLSAIPTGKKTYLWLSSTDGTAQVFVNGQPVPYVDVRGVKQDRADGYCQPFSFDITAAVRGGETNQITIASKRVFLNEFGTGGLLSAAYLHRDK